MIAALTAFITLLVAAWIVLPLLGQAKAVVAEAGPGGNELWRREKAVAVLAISEADFDRATGKLSDEDYRVLRSDYEGRALHAMDEIDRLAPAPATAGDAAQPAGGEQARFCSACGNRFAEPDAFCAACGRARSGL